MFNDPKEEKLWISPFHTILPTLLKTKLRKTNLGKTLLENVEGKGDNAGHQHFLLFLQCFLPFPTQILTF